MIKWFKQLILFLHHGLKSFSNAISWRVLRGVCEYSTNPITLLYPGDVYCYCINFNTGVKWNKSYFIYLWYKYTTHLFPASLKVITSATVI
jgi:hypothetical protein